MMSNNQNYKSILTLILFLEKFHYKNHENFSLDNILDKKYINNYNLMFFSSLF